MNFLSLTHNRLLMLLIIGLMLAACDPQTGMVRDPGGITSDSASYTHGLGSQILSSYSGSYALLIGESRYDSWPNLESIPGELRNVEKVLQSQGFKVEKSFNLNAKEFAERFDRFINEYGFEENNRLLFFYSGHGYTRKAKGTHKDKGYIVPVDAANPNVDETAFLRKAVGMNLVITWAQEIEAKHVLFLFDSCFSGTVFKERDLPKAPRQISQAAEKPVRQFITAGSAGETVPAKSVFTPAFVDALRYGFGDTNKDGYVTGQELGLHLWNKVPKYDTEQTPQYGKIKDYELSRGDFVFVVDEDVQDQVSNNTTHSEVFNTGKNSEVFNTGKNFAINFGKKIWDDFDHDCYKTDSLLIKVTTKLKEQKELLNYQNVGDSEKEFNHGYTEGSLQIVEVVSAHCAEQCAKVGQITGQISADVFCNISETIEHTAKFRWMEDIPNIGCGEPYRISCESSFYVEAKNKCPSYANGPDFEKYYRVSHGGSCSYNPSQGGE
ncbi:caspase family protein [Candidatus Parabeggiatoa sp. HSG14]|uniref:caspase family protein n=1 Tax=Candidatus Parabeggiatoa sp. HSG14 TaxID=3055593 RepID=UPI0025A82B76|nr:caspase family protein [Thiotrichales bacterium HSG14]